MQLIKKTKKGFTLVELIVVIAIVAILAAVSVVSYIAFINSANESADIQLVKQLNTFLAGDETLHDGKARSTMDEMLTVMLDHGFFVENLTRTASGNDIVWDQANNRFALVNDSGKIWAEDSFADAPKYQIWYFVNSIKEAEQRSNKGHYSVYLTEDVGNQSVLNISTGFDTGKNIIETVNYDHTGEKQVVTFRTNSFGTTLNINAPSDEIHHYNNLGKLVATKLDYSCYYEHGTLAYAVVDEGKVIADGGTISVLYATTANKVAVEERNEGDVVNAYCTATSKETKDSDYKAFSDSKGGNVDFGYKPEDEIVDEGENKISEEISNEVSKEDESYVCRLGTDGYLRIQDAIQHIAHDGIEKRIDVLKDIDNDAFSASYNQKVLIELNGHEMKTTNKRAEAFNAQGISMGTLAASVLAVGGAQITIRNGTIKCWGTSNTGNSYSLIRTYGTGNTITLKNVNAVHNGTMSGDIVINNTVGNTVNVIDSIVNGLPGYGNVVTNDGEFNVYGNSQLIKEFIFGDIVTNHGTVNVYGGSFQYNATGARYCIKNVVSQGVYDNPTINIYGGTFGSAQAFNTSSGTVNVSGGTFSNEVSNVDGHVTVSGNVVDNGDGTWTVVPNN